MQGYEGTRKVVRFDAQRRWPRVVNAVARYMGGPSPADDDVRDALDALADYVVLRSLALAARPELRPDADGLRRSISNAVAAR